MANVSLVTLDDWSWLWFQHYFKLESLLLLKPLGKQGRSFLGMLNSQKVVLKFSSGMQRVHTALYDIQRHKTLRRRMPRVFFNSFFSHFRDPLDSFNLEFRLDGERYFIADINCFTIREYIEGSSLADLGLPEDLTLIRSQLRETFELFHRSNFVLRKISLKDIVLDNYGQYRLIQIRHAEDLVSYFDEEIYRRTVPTIDQDFRALEYFFDFPYQKWHLE